jgi:hypothetical protein
MVLSFSCKEAMIWSPSKNMLAWLSCHSRAFERLGGVPATVRVHNEKTAVVRGAGAWDVVNPTYRHYANALSVHVDACPPRRPRFKGAMPGICLASSPLRVGALTDAGGCPKRRTRYGPRNRAQPLQ